jgi:hypothetical protein
MSLQISADTESDEIGLYLEHAKSVPTEIWGGVTGSVSAALCGTGL